MTSPWVRIKKNGNPHQNHVVSMCCSNIKKNYVCFAWQNEFDFIYAFLWLLFWYYLHRILYFAQKWSNFPSEHRLKCHLFCARCAKRNVRLSYLWTWCNAIPSIYIWLRKDGVFFQQKKKLKNQIIFLLWFDLSVSLLSKWNFVRSKRLFYLENVVFSAKYVVSRICCLITVQRWPLMK